MPVVDQRNFSFQKVSRATMSEVIIPLLSFICLVAASLGSLAAHKRIPAHHRQEDTHAIVKLAVNLIVVMTSLVLGLMISTAKNTFESVDRNVHAFATDLILFDRLLVEYGPETKDTRRLLLEYVKQAVDGTWPATGESLIDDTKAEGLLNEVGNSLVSITPADAEHAELKRDALGRFQKVVEQRWVLVEQSDGTIPPPLIAILATWLVLIFASFGFRAPNNPVVIATVVIAAALISGAIYLILDMDVPFSGPIKISPTPLERVIAQMQE
jgi:hypothetical protein